jgi:dihydroxy-acid dehydratase
VFDVQNRRLDLEVEPSVIEARLREWSPPATRYPTGVMAKYARLVGSASEGAVTNQL